MDMIVETLDKKPIDLWRDWTIWRFDIKQSKLVYLLLILCWNLPVPLSQTVRVKRIKFTLRSTSDDQDSHLLHLIQNMTLLVQMAVPLSHFSTHSGYQIPKKYNWPMGRMRKNNGLRISRECRECFPRHSGLAIPTCITARAWCTCRDACRNR